MGAAAALLAVLLALAHLAAPDPAHADAPDRIKMKAAAGDRRVTLLWEAPDDGGSALIRYEYRYTSTGTLPDAWTEIPNGIDLPEDMLSNFIAYVVPDMLINGTEYTFQMRAVNADGAGAVEEDSVSMATPAGNQPATGTLNFSGEPRVPRAIHVFPDDSMGDLVIQDADGLMHAEENEDYFKLVYHWFRVVGGRETPIQTPHPGGTDGDEYILVDADAGSKIRVEATFVDDRGNPETVSAVFPPGDATIAPRPACPAPTYSGGAVRIWTGTLAVTHVEGLGGFVSKYGTGSADGFREGGDFTAGGNPYRIDAAYRAVLGPETDTLVFSLEQALDAADRDRLVLHVCDREFRFADATAEASEHHYRWDSMLDWSDVSRRILHLSYDAASPTLTRTALTGASLALTFSEDLDPDSVPAIADFSVMVNGAVAAFADGSAPVIAGRTVTLTLAGPPAGDAGVTVSYTAPASNPLRDRARNAVANIAERTVVAPATVRPDPDTPDPDTPDPDTPEPERPEPEEMAMAESAAPWLMRFGRTAAGQVADAVSDRLAASPSPGLAVRLGGQRIAAAPPGGIEELEEREGAAPRFARSRTLTGRQFITASSFNLAGGTGGAGLVGVWGRVALAGFRGRKRERGVDVDGAVASAFLGADYTLGRAAIGMLLTRSEGEGEYGSPLGRGSVESALTGLYPYLRYAFHDRLSVWGAAGYGEGALTLTPDGRAAVRSDMDMRMVAGGLRGLLQDPAKGERIRLAVVADALGLRTTAARADNGETRLLRSVDAEVTRVKLGIEGGLSGIAIGEHRLRPTLEIAGRHDGGDAETGYGLDIGGRLAWSAPGAGLEVKIRGRGLVSHDSRGFRQTGGSLSVAWDPDPSSGRGLSLSLAQRVGGPASGGAGALLARETSEGLAGDGDGDMFRDHRLEAKLGYGIAVPGGWLVATPEARLALSPAHRELGLGWRLGPARRHLVSFDFGLRATRREAAGGDRPPEHGVSVNGTMRW